MHVFFKCKILCRSQRHTRCGNSLDSRVICKVDEKDGTVKSTCLAEGLNEEVRFLECDTHCGKYNGERLIGSDDLGLAGDLRAEVGMRKT